MPLIQFSNKNKYGTLRTRILYVESMPFSINPRGFGDTIIVQVFKYKHEHYLPPILFTATNGKKYIAPTMVEVIPETTLYDIEWIQPKLTGEVKQAKIEPNIYRFESKSEPGSFYTVTQKGDKLKCDCPGFFRCRDKNIGCKHCQEVRSRGFIWKPKE